MNGIKARYESEASPPPLAQTSLVPGSAAVCLEVETYVRGGGCILFFFWIRSILLSAKVA
jgi:hypothetical protein